MDTLLIVEDEKLIRQGTKTIIERSGIPIQSILECANGVAALEILQKQRIDVVFTDIRMPKMDGIELVKRIQKLKQKPLVVAISGYDDFNYAVQLLREGVREYILKPIDRTQIKTILQELNQEIEANRNQEKDEKIIGQQQLKNFILNQYLTYSERSFIIRKYGQSCLSKPYRVGCTLMNQVIGDVLSESIVLEGVEDHTLYVTNAKEDQEALTTQGCYVGISREHIGIEALILAYQEALFARRQAFYYNKRFVILEEDIPNRTVESEQSFGEKQMIQVVQMVGTHKIEEGLRIIKRMGVAVVSGKLSFIEFEANIQLLIEEIGKTYQNILEIDHEEVFKLTHVLRYPSIYVYMEALISWIVRINQNITGQFDDYKNKQKINEAIIYTKANYNRDLNMAVVSNHISMNYSLFSHLFKEYTGENFVSYLKKLRMEEAEKLLNTTDYRINEISHRVGYENDKHFMKTFKSVYGVSPTEYRKNMIYRQKND